MAILVFKMYLVVFLSLSPIDQAGLCNAVGEVAMEHFQCAEGTLIVDSSEGGKYAEFYFICEKRMTKEDKDGRDKGIPKADDKGRAG